MKTKMKVLLSCLAVLGIAGNARASFYGDPLIERGYATDFPVGSGSSSPVLVVNPVVLPAGTLTSFETWDQVEPGGSSFASAGNTLTAYILQPTLVAGQFTVTFASGLLTVPTVATSQTATFAVSPSFQTVAGDQIAFYGQGVPVDITGAGSLQLYYPSLSAPTLGETITLGSGDFPNFPQDRLYSFGANVTPVPEASTVIAGALLLLPFGASTLRILRRNRMA
jgi:hypothetical protein